MIKKVELAIGLVTATPKEPEILDTSASSILSSDNKPLYAYRGKIVVNDAFSAEFVANPEETSDLAMDSLLVKLGEIFKTPLPETPKEEVSVIEPAHPSKIIIS